MKSLHLSFLCLMVATVGFAISQSHAQEIVSVDAKQKAVVEGGHVLVPITLKNFASIRAARVVIEYDGDLRDATFEPTDYLNEPLVMPIRIDKAKKTIDISIAATRKVETRNKDGIIGFLKLDADSRVTAFQVVRVEYVDGDRNWNLLVDSQIEESGLSQSAASEVVEPGISATRLYQNFPNPSNPTTIISFDLKEDAPVRLDIFDVNGALVTTLVNRSLRREHHEIGWDGRDRLGSPVSSGVYFYRLRAGSYAETKKLLILK